MEAIMPQIPEPGIFGVSKRLMNSRKIIEELPNKRKKWLFKIYIHVSFMNGIKIYMVNNFYRRDELVEQTIIVEQPLTKTPVRLVDLADEELVGKIQSGSEAAFAELTKRYMRKSYSIAYQVVGDMEAARDLSQDVFTKIFVSINKYKEGSKFFSWFYRILMNHCINYKRRQKVVSMLPFSSVFKTPDEADHFHSYNDTESESLSDKQRIIQLALNELSAKHKQVVILCDLEDFLQEEAADILEITVGTVRSRLHYARKNLKKSLSKYKKELEL
jgi:RNA polymerase sigma-70 factor (ECF subfamily)